MPRIFALLLAVCLLAGGCGKSPAPKRAEALAKPLAELVDSLAETALLPMPAALDDQLAAQLFDLNLDDVAEYAGYISLAEGCPDQLLGARAKPGRGEAVAKALETRRAFVVEACRLGPAEPLARAQAGTVVFRGDYVFLLMAGRPGLDPVAQTAALVSAVEDSFQK